MENAIKCINEWINKTMLSGDVSIGLDLSELNLNELPTLPPNLQILDCNNNNLTSLPDLPPNLQILNCNNNNLTSLPDNLPNTLKKLYCKYNEIKELPLNLPLNLQRLNCAFNKITSLPDLPSNLNFLTCDELETSPEIPNSLEYINICESTEIIRGYDRNSFYVFKLRNLLYKFKNDNEKLKQELKNKFEEIKQLRNLKNLSLENTLSYVIKQYVKN